MPVENLEEESLAKNPNLDLAQLKFTLMTQGQNQVLATKLLEEIKANNMAPFYKDVSIP